MKISTKGRYALRLMLDIALHSEGKAVALRDVARRQEISDKYLEQIVMHLTRGGLVRSVRGAGGGYLLTRPAQDYTVGDILRQMEGDMSPVSCAVEGCSRACDCGTIEVWTSIHQAVTDVVDNMTLGYLVDQARKKQKGGL